MCFLPTVHGWLRFSSRGHAEEKDIPPLLSVFKSFLSVLLLCGSFLAADLFGNLISDKADLCPVFLHSFSSFIIIASLSGVNVSFAELKHFAGLTVV